MHIVSAGVHTAVPGGKRHAGLLGNRQGVHVCAEQKHLARLASAGKDTQPRPAAIFRHVSHLFQFGFDVGQCVRQRKAGFGVGVQVLAVFAKFRRQRGCFV